MYTIAKMDSRNSISAVLTADWRMWCRLCAKDDTSSNIDVFVEEEQPRQLEVTTTVYKMFGVQISQSDDLPRMLCTECFTMLTTFVTFSERVVKTQLMYQTLSQQNVADWHENLHIMRAKYAILDGERDHVSFPPQQPISKCFSVKTKREQQIEKEGAAQHMNHFSMKTYVRQNVKLDDCCLLEVENEQMQDMLTDVEALAGEVENENNEHDNERLMAVDPLNTGDDDDVSADQALRSTVVADGEAAVINRQRHKRKASSTANLSENAFGMVRRRDADDISTPEPLISWTKGADGKSTTIYSCCKCAHKCVLLNSYRSHYRRKHIERPSTPQEFRCDQCDRICSTQFKLTQHVRAHQTAASKKTTTCPYCHRKFSANALKQHIQGTHLNERPFVCEECGIAVRTKGALKSHMQTHTNHKPFVCDVCHKAYKDHKTLKAHKEIHDPNKHVCSQCGLQLNSRTTLYRHLLVHSDEMKHKCGFCGRAFKRSKTLKAHLILHTGLKPYSCDFCDRTFANGSNCRSHKKKAHPDELAALQAIGGDKTYTHNIPKLEVLKTVTKAADNLIPVVSKQSGCFSFGKKRKATITTKHADNNAIKCTGDKDNLTSVTQWPTPTMTSVNTIDNIFNHTI